MNSKLPEKLALLRKYYGYSQGDIAQKLDIPVTEYMNWENGNTICSIYQLKQLADIFAVPVQALFDNQKIIKVPDEPFQKTEEIEVPAAESEALEYNPKQFTQSPTRIGDDAPTSVMESLEDVAHVSMSDTDQFQATLNNEIVDELPSDAIEKVPAHKPSSPNKQKRNQRSLVIASCIGLAVLIGLMIIANLWMNRKPNLSLTSENRLALGDTYSLYIDKNETLMVRGDFNAQQAFQGVVQVSAYDHNALGLQYDGTVVNSVGNDTSALQNSVAIAAGKNHSVGLHKDGTVSCVGSDSACHVSDWVDIKKIYAGNEVTIGITKGASLKVSGNAPQGLEEATAVQDISISDTHIGVLYNDGHVEVFANANQAFDTTSWKNINEIESGNHFIAGLTNSGTVEIVFDSPDIENREFMEKQVSRWSSIRYLKANGDTLVAMDQAENMYGIGDNTNNKYDASEEPTPEPIEATALSAVQNISFSETTGNVQISWDAVENADYYEVSIDTNPSTTTRTSNNSTSIKASNLQNGATYNVTIVALSNDQKRFKPSEATSVQYKYSAKTIQLNAPTNLTSKLNDDGSWTFTWDKVDHADYYRFIFGDNDAIDVHDTAYTITGEITEGQAFKVLVTAKSNEAKYTESSATEGEFKYQGLKFDITFVFKDESNQQVGDYHVNVPAKVYEVQELIEGNVPEGYILVDPKEKIEVFSNIGRLDISVKKVETPEPQPEENTENG